MDRRQFLRAAAAGVASVAFDFRLSVGWLDGGVSGAAGRYGPLRPPDANGVRLPEGFSSRVIARSTQTVPGTDHIWHSAPDGGACFADGREWVYVSNAEIDGGAGGASAVRFSSSGRVVDAYRILSGTNRNCGGGATPWNTWLSCEEVDRGYVYETDPWGAQTAARRPAMGRFAHEAVAADPDRRVIYQTEDVADGCFYRFVPASWGDLSSGTLQVLTETNQVLKWAEVPDPPGTVTPTRYQLSNARKFNGGEGCHYRAGTCYFTTKGDNRVWAYNADRNTLTITYTYDVMSSSALRGPDNVTGTTTGDLYVAEDGGDMQICVITPDDVVAPFLAVPGQTMSELCGPAFNPAGDRFYFSSQRGTSGSSSGGITYEVTGPFRAGIC